MFNAQLLFGASGGSTSVYSPWFPRQGDYLRATAELVALGGATNFKAEVFHKNKEDTGDGVLVGSAITLTAVGRDDVEISGLKELVRYKMTCTGTASQWVLFRMLAPVWFDAVKV